MVSRRQFLRGDFKAGSRLQRPPWALPEEDFQKACSRCGDCAPVCATEIIVVVRGFPEVDFRRGECTFCGNCATACKDGALPRTGKGASPWTIKAVIAANCMARHSVECRVCGDPCPEAAIRFSPRAGGPPEPEIDVAACTGCGACVAPCPVAAISVE
jgi:ferredoxin-type protein NapF